MTEEEKIAFMSEFENFLENGVEGYERDINFILPKKYLNNYLIY